MTDTEARAKFDDLVGPYLSENQRNTLVKELSTIDIAASVGLMLDLTCSDDQAFRMAGED